MSYEIRTSENGRYIICRVTQSITVELAREFTIALDQLSRSQRIKRFLVDVRGAPNVASVFQNFDFANKDMADLDLQRDVRSAILVGANDRSHDFVETVTQNAGYGVRVFDDEAAAIAWLEALT